jgi:hypothetical protein
MGLLFAVVGEGRRRRERKTLLIGLFKELFLLAAAKGCHEGLLDG